MKYTNKSKQNMTMCMEKIGTEKISNHLRYITKVTGNICYI